MVTARDSSGNGYDGEYRLSPLRPLLFTAGVVSGDRACDFSGGTAGAQSQTAVVLPIVPTQWDIDWSVEMWLQSPIGGAAITGTSTVYLSNALGNSEPIGIQTNSGSITVGYGRSSSRWTSTSGIPNNGLPHHLVVTKSGFVELLPDLPGIFTTTVRVYLDTSPLTLTIAASGYLSAVAIPHAQAILGSNSGWITDEFAVYPGVLGAGAISAHHAAASVSFAAYTAAVLADSPTVYYHLNDELLGGWSVGRVGMAAT